MQYRKFLRVEFVRRYAAGISLAAGMCLAQTDPGPRGGSPGAGGAIAGLNAGELSFSNTTGAPNVRRGGAVANGLGPRFNLDSCGGCHAFPALGGSSPAVNPQVARAGIMAPGSTVPAFLTANGPVREVRFVKNADGTAMALPMEAFMISSQSPDVPTSRPVGSDMITRPSTLEARTCPTSRLSGRS